MAHINLEVATPLGLVLKTSADSVSAPSVHGEFGVLPGHLPVLSALRPGVLTYQSENQTHRAAIGAGFVEAGPEKVLILCDKFVEASNIHEEEVRAELAAAEKELASFGEVGEGLRYEELKHAIDWCLAKLEIKSLEAKRTN